MRIKDKWLKLPAVILFLYILIRVLDYGKIILYHPLSNLKHDFYSYGPILYFLKQCGFHAACPYWYNGFTTFTAAPPGWYFFTYPFYYLTDNLRLSYYLSYFLIFALIGISIWFLGKRIGMTRVQRFAFFAFFIGNNVFMNTARLARIPEIFSWLFFIIGFFILYSYKDKPVDSRFYWLILPYSFSILSYHAVAILFSFLLLGFFFIHIKSHFKPVFIVVLSSLLLTSFWWGYTLRHLDRTSLLNHLAGVEPWWMFDEFTHFTSIAVIVLPLLTFLSFYFYYKTNKQSSHLAFFLPSLLLLFLFLLGILPFVPVLRQIYTHIYFTFMIFLILIFAFDINYTALKLPSNFLITAGLTLVALLTIAINLSNTPFFDKPTAEHEKLATLLKQADAPFILVGSLTSLPSHRTAYYSYAAVELNKTTVEGHYPAEVTPFYLKDTDLIHKSLASGDCQTLLTKSRTYSLSYFLGYGPVCSTLSSCGLQEVNSLPPACLYKVPSLTT